MIGVKLILRSRMCYVANPSSLRSAKQSYTRAMGYFVYFIRMVMTVTKRTGFAKIPRIFMMCRTFKCCVLIQQGDGSRAGCCLAQHCTLQWKRAGAPPCLGSPLFGAKILFSLAHKLKPISVNSQKHYRTMALMWLQSKKLPILQEFPRL